MASRAKPQKRIRGTIDTLPSGSLRVRVYAGTDPVSGERHNLVEVIPAGPDAANLAEKARTRMLGEVDERRNARTKATIDQSITAGIAVTRRRTCSIARSER
jgi:integrase